MICLIVIALILSFSVPNRNVTNYFLSVYSQTNAIPNLQTINYVWLLSAIHNNFVTGNSTFITSIYTFLNGTRNVFQVNPITPETSYETIVQTLPIINELTTDSFFQDNKFLCINKFDKNNWTNYYNESQYTTEYLEVNNTGGVTYGQVLSIPIPHLWFYWTQGSGIFFKPTTRIIGLNKYEVIYKAYTQSSKDPVAAFLTFANQLKQYLAIQNLTITQVLQTMLVGSATRIIESFFNITIDEFNNLLTFLRIQGAIGIPFGTDDNDLILSGLMKVNLNHNLVQNETLRYALYSQIDLFLFSSTGISDVPLDAFIKLILLNTNIQVGPTLFGLVSPLAIPIDTLIFVVQWNYFSGWATEMTSSKIDKTLKNGKLTPTLYYKKDDTFQELPDFPINDKWSSIATSVVPATLLTFA